MKRHLVLQVDVQLGGAIVQAPESHRELRQRHLAVAVVLHGGAVARGERVGVARGGSAQRLPEKGMLLQIGRGEARTLHVRVGHGLVQRVWRGRLRKGGRVASSTHLSGLLLCVARDCVFELRFLECEVPALQTRLWSACALQGLAQSRPGCALRCAATRLQRAHCQDCHQRALQSACLETVNSRLTGAGPHRMRRCSQRLFHSVARRSTRHGCDGVLLTCRGGGGWSSGSSMLATAPPAVCCTQACTTEECRAEWKTG